MRYPQLREPDTDRQMVDVFKGYNHNLRIGSGEFFDMKNMTSDYYPVLSPRGKRGVYGAGTSLQGLIAKDTLCYVDGADFVIGGNKVSLGLSTEEADCPKQLVSMGAYVIIMPDKKYVNTKDLSDYGDIEASFTAADDVTFEFCNLTGDVYRYTIASSTEPEVTDEISWDVWFDTSTYPWTPKRYSPSSGTWVTITSTYVKIFTPGIGAAFSQHDGVTISGIVKSEAKELNGNFVVMGCGEDYIIVTGLVTGSITQELSEGIIQVNRSMPNLDYIIESENRLWGCRYGTAVNGEMVNEIYASKLGDFRNWNNFAGISTDSYVASCGSDGPFTGAVTHMGYPLFFKENCVHKVFGNYPANYQIQTTVCRGVQKGCHKSLAMVNETLFYKARSGIMAYDGSLPVEASYALGNEAYSDAVAGAVGNKYYISMKDGCGEWHLFVYDVAKGMWHREDNFRAVDFCYCRGELYGIDPERKGIMAMTGTGTKEPDAVSWMVETGELGISSPDMKYISRITLRMKLEIGAQLQIYAQYDMSDSWEPLCNLTGTSLRSFSIPVRPRRCDHMKLRMEGVGDVKIYSITKTIETGSEIS